MAIVIIGGGPVGLFIAGQLVKAIPHVALLARKTTVQAIQSQGLCIIQPDHGQDIRHLTVAETPAQLPAPYQQPDLAILCIKGYDTLSVLPTLDMLAPRQILSLQNGIGNEEILADRSGTRQILAGVLTSAVELVAPACARVTRVGGIGLAHVSPQADISLSARVLRNAGFSVRTYADYRAMKWSKLLMNIMGNATAAILDMPVSEVYTDPRLLRMERHAFLEGLAVMERLGLHPVNLPGGPVARAAPLIQHLPPFVLYPLLRRFVGGGRGGKVPSLQYDLMRRRSQSEGAYLYGAIVSHAHELGMAVPVNTTLWQVLHGIISHTIAWDSFRHQPERLVAMSRGAACYASSGQINS